MLNFDELVTILQCIDHVQKYLSTYNSLDNIIDFSVLEALHDKIEDMIEFYKD